MWSAFEDQLIADQDNLDEVEHGELEAAAVEGVMHIEEILPAVVEAALTDGDSDCQDALNIALMNGLSQLINGYESQEIRNDMLAEALNYIRTNVK